MVGLGDWIMLNRLLMILNEKNSFSFPVGHRCREVSSCSRVYIRAKRSDALTTSRGVIST